MKIDTTAMCMRCSDRLGDAKMSKKTPRFVEFHVFTNCNRRKRFRRMKAIFALRKMQILLFEFNYQYVSWNVPFRFSVSLTVAITQQVTAAVWQVSLVKGATNPVKIWPLDLDVPRPVTASTERRAMAAQESVSAPMAISEKRKKWLCPFYTFINIDIDCGIALRLITIKLNGERDSQSPKPHKRGGKNNKLQACWRKKLSHLVTIFFVYPIKVQHDLPVI